MNDASVALVTVVGVLAGIAILLVLMSALDPTNERRKLPSQGRAALPRPGADQRRAM